MNATASHRSIRVHTTIAAIVIALLALGVGGWAATAEFAGAVVAQAQLVVDSNVKTVQHPTGGVVEELLVEEGEGVSAGQIVVRLDATQTRANLAIVSSNLDELTARKARLEAEREADTELRYPPEFARRAEDEPRIARLVRSEARVFDLRRAAREGKKNQLGERIIQLGEQIIGLEAQIKAKENEARLIEEELGAVSKLWEKKLTPMSRVKALEREVARIEGERGALVAAAAEMRGRITETELQILQLDQDLRSEVATQLADINAKIQEFAERKIAAEDQLSRVDIRAPRDGVVHELQVHTVGGVVAPGGPIMHIVPKDDELRLEARVQPDRIDQVHLGQSAAVTFPAFNRQTTPELNGEVSRIGADLTTDEKTGIGYYSVRIAVTNSEFSKLGDVRLVPGMPAEVFIRTDQRTVLSYFVKPLSDQVRRAFRER